MTSSEGGDGSPGTRTGPSVPLSETKAELFKALGHPARIRCLEVLAAGERSVGELAEFLGIRDATASQHLALLRKDGLVNARREGQTIWYSIASVPAREILSTLYRIYCQPERLCEPQTDTITHTEEAKA